ncbi:hypothetical protein AALO_G00025040 [Alosa alosa]|uniref:Uncharacterized protein n=1 Tax=Alosa alosa TaxID=278164 RepID=A0AAV6HA81_9TELE|nr:hypothetical protein AALO_G00025040 [Alosa alosa]
MPECTALHTGEKICVTLGAAQRSPWGGPHSQQFGELNPTKGSFGGSVSLYACVYKLTHTLHTLLQVHPCGLKVCLAIVSLCNLTKWKHCHKEHELL